MENKPECFERWRELCAGDAPGLIALVLRRPDQTTLIARRALAVAAACLESLATAERDGPKYVRCLRGGPGRGGPERGVVGVVREPDDAEGWVVVEDGVGNIIDAYAPDHTHHFTEEWEPMPGPAEASGDHGVGFSFAGMSGTEAELRLWVGGSEGSAFVSRELWEAVARKAGWIDPSRRASATSTPWGPRQ